MSAAPATSPPPPHPGAGSHHRREWLLASLFVVGGAMVVLAGVAGAVKAPDRPLRVGANFWIGYEPLRFLPEPHGRTAPRIVELRSTSAVLEGLRAGTLDAAALTIDEAIRHSGPDLPLAIVLVLDRSEGADAVLARRGVAAIPYPGARIGVETEGVGALVLSRFLATAGLAETDVRVVDMPASSHGTAFASGSVDYVVTYEPHVSALEKAGASRIFDSRRMTGEVVDVLVVRREVLVERRADVEALVTGWFRGLDRMREDLTGGSGAIARRLGLEAADMAAILGGLTFPSREENHRMLTDGSVGGVVANLSAWVRAHGVTDAGRWLTVAAVPSTR